MSLRVLVATLAAAAAVTATAQEVYVFDAGHSRPSFEVRHLNLTFQYGHFDKIAGKATLDRAAKKGSVDVTIDAASVRIFDPRLDAALKGEKFLNVEKFPTITFKSTNVVFDGDRVVAVDGDLTLLGVTKPVSLKMVNFACGEHPFNKKPMCGADAVATIKRSDFGMTAGIPYAPADEVRILIPVEAYKEQAG